MVNRLLIVALALLLALAGCTDAPDDTQDDDGTDDTDDGGDDATGGDGNGTIPPDPEEVEVRTDGNYPVNPGFDPGELTVTAGANVTLTFYNDDVAAPHGWRIDGVDGASIGSVEPDDSAEITFIAPEPGEYTFYCPVGNHRELGQEGTLVVEEA